MKTLSIKQPWASLIAHGIKDVENRTWKTKYKGKILIHASLTSQTGAYRDFLPKDFWMGLSEDERNKIICTSQFRGAIIGEVEIVDCVPNYPSIWSEVDLTGTKPIWNWVLANAKLYDEPILNVKGKLMLWEYNDIKINNHEL